MRNPLEYTFRTYNTILTELNAMYPNKPDWFMEIISGLFDILHWYLDARAQNLLLPSAYTPEAIYDLCAYLDYYPNGASAGGGECTFVTDFVSFPTTIPASELTLSIVTSTGDTVNFEAANDAIFDTATTTTSPVFFYEGITLSGIDIGTSDGSTEWQEFVFPDRNILEYSVTTLLINSQEWTRQSTLVNSTSIDRHFTILRKPDGYLAAMFGDGTYGAIPGVYPITATYRVGGGAIGNVKIVGSTVNYTGPNTHITSVAMAEDFNGGAEAETPERARSLAPKMLKYREQAVTEASYTYLAKRFSTGIIQAIAFPGLYGDGTVGVHIVPAGGGLPSTALKSDLQIYLRDRSTLGLTDIRVRDPLYVSQGITLNVTARPGYLTATVERQVDLCARLFVSEQTQELLDIFASGGIVDAVNYINTYMPGYSFTSSDYPIISDILRRRQRDGAPTWGTGLIPNDIVGAVDDMASVDTVSVSLPASPVTLAFTQIFTPGTISVTVA